METETEIGHQTSLAEITQEVKQAQEDAKANSRFVQLSDGEAAEFEFTGVVYKRKTSGTDSSGKAFEAVKYDFELAEVTPNGEPKVFSLGVSNKLVPQLVAALQAGKRTLTISRQGVGTATKYSIITVQKRK